MYVHTTKSNFFEEFTFLAHKLSIISANLQYKVENEVHCKYVQWNYSGSALKKL